MTQPGTAPPANTPANTSGTSSTAGLPEISSARQEAIAQLHGTAPKTDVEAPKTDVEAPKTDAEKRAEFHSRLEKNQAKFKEQRRSVSALKAERQRLAASKAEYDRKLDLSTKEPLKWLADEGKVTTDDIIRRKLGEQKTEQEIPEAVKQALAARDTEIRALKDEQAARARAEFDRKSQEDHVLGSKAFLEVIKDDTKYPALNALYEPEQQTAAAWKVMTQAADAVIQKYGMGLSQEQIMSLLPTKEEIAEYLEADCKPRYDKLVSKFKPQNGTAPKVEGPLVKVPLTQTLTNRVASQKVEGSKPYEKMNRSEQLDHDVAEYNRRLVEKGHKI